MPCLNEEASVGLCVAKAWAGIVSTGLTGEVIVADNGSADRSVHVAEAAGAQVVHQPRRGYGNAYLCGFSAARGRIVVMGDSDDSYDFTALPALIGPIEAGYEYVLGSRFAGRIHRDAMSWSHRRIGNPVLTTILNVLFGLRVTDAHSGFRAITREALGRLALRSEGMELASEIVVKAARARLRTAEVPIDYHPRIGASKLNSVRDGWRHLRFLLLLSPEYLFVGPAVILATLGVLGQLLLFAVDGGPGPLFGKILTALVTVSGVQLLTFGVFAKVYSDNTGLGSVAAGDQGPEPDSWATTWTRRVFTLERGLAAGTVVACGGLIILIAQVITGFDGLAAGGPAASVTILGLEAVVLGGELCSAAFFLSLALQKQPIGPRDDHCATIGKSPDPAAQAAGNERLSAEIT
jgi:hypothetical protein